MTETTRISQQLVPLPITIRPTQVYSNFFTPVNPNLPIHIYSIEFQPSVENENRVLRGKLIRSVEDEVSRLVGAHTVSGINLFAVRENQEVLTVLCTSEGAEYVMTLRHVRRVTTEFSQGRKDTQLVLNVILKRALREMGFRQLTRLPKFFNPGRENIVPLTQYSLEIWRGYTAELTMRLGGPFINIDFSSKIVHTRTLNDEMIDVMRDTQGDIEEVRSRFTGRIVIARYGNRRCYRVDDICMHMHPTNTFQRNGVDVTYVDYFRTQYNENITDMRQPLLRCHIKRRLEEFDIYLVPELVALTGLDDKMRADSRAMFEIAKTTRFDPQRRLDYSRHLAKGFNRHPQAREVLTRFGFQVEEQAHPVPAYSISGESITMREKCSVNNGQFQTRGDLNRPVSLRNWCIMRVEKDNANARQFASELHRKLSSIHVENSEPQMIPYDKPSFPSTLQRILERDPPQIIVILLPDSRRKDYEAIKKLTTTTAAIVTQVVMMPINKQRFNSIIEKVALQIQAKIGAEVWIMNSLQNANFGKYLMVVGIDVFHDTVNRRKSVLGFCATVSPNLNKYYSTIAMHETGQDIATAIGNLFQEAVEVFRRKSGHCPETVVFFRDGVGDSQLEAVREFEVASVLATCQRITDNERPYDPNIIYTVVNKKTSTRLFAPQTPGRDSTVTNPPPGTLIISDIVPATGDFYLISHSANQGMAAPSLYRTIYASRPERFQLEDLARLAYRLCHMYYNWSGAIKVPAPCMMAHKLAYLVGQCVHQPVSEKIRCNSFYL